MRFTKREYGLWIFSMLIVIISNVLPGQLDMLTLIAALVGVTSLIFAAKGNVVAQLLMILFSILYGVISYRFHYWGEMVTYLGMTMPMAIWSAITWFRNPSEQAKGEVKIQRLMGKQWCGLGIATGLVTIVFYFILDYFQTPNLFFSTLSIATSFLAAALTMLRSSYFAFVYALNDLVLIVLWSYASMKNPEYIPVIVNFVIFFINDMYGFWNWKKRESKRGV